LSVFNPHLYLCLHDVVLVDLGILGIFINLEPCFRSEGLDGVGMGGVTFQSVEGGEDESFIILLIPNNCLYNVPIFVF